MLLMYGERVICTECLIHLPKSNYHKFEDNPVAKVFWGRAQVSNATAFYVFEKGSKYQKLIHKMKYKGQYSRAEKYMIKKRPDLRRKATFINE